jgi:hypothetical protein
MAPATHRLKATTPSGQVAGAENNDRQLKLASTSSAL